MNQSRKFYFLNGHPSRLQARGLKIKFSYTKFSSGYHRSAVCSDELSDEHASALATLVGQLGVREIDEAEFLKVTGRGVKSLPAPRIRAVVPAAPQAAKYSHPHVYVMLGRYGDICNVLPMLKADADAGRRPTLVVSKDFADILDGVSYCDRIVWDGAYDQLPEALRWLRRDKGIVAPVIPQFHRNPYDKARLTDSYMKEVWRLAGRLNEFDSRGPLVFDRRDADREAALALRATGGIIKPLILVGLKSHSSPLDNAYKIMAEIVRRFSGTHTIIDLATIEARRIYDLIGLFDRAAALVTSDTSFLHLARATNISVVAFTNDGWRGSVIHENVRALPYSQVTPEKAGYMIDDSLSKPFGQHYEVIAPLLTHAAMASIKRGDSPSSTFFDVRPRVYHVADTFGASPRHHATQSSWNSAYADQMIPAHYQGGKRNAKIELGDPRELPFLKDVLWSAIPEDATQWGGDIIVWTNSDIGFAPGATAFIRDHVSKHHAATMRRTESNGNGHPGRDLFAFTVDWLMEHFDEMPDYVIGAPVFDLGIVAMIRRFHGLPHLTLKNLAEDMAPADMMPGYALHQSHEPEWCVRNMSSVPSYAHNRKLFKAWAAKYCPEIKFSPAGNIK